MPGLFDYRVGQQIALGRPPFYALIQAAATAADPVNLAALEHAFPAELAELHLRYVCPGGEVDEARVARVRAAAEAKAGVTAR